MTSVGNCEESAKVIVVTASLIAQSKVDVTAGVAVPAHCPVPHP